ncbi:class I SAM-dependent methyltransferase [Paralimibaculum aggregatum]|uniref:Class I SAM-dependent methyltransferase n=1 Tax=Paralimibaculum aggregatum TaxID=3036245 RepID=A0ABQ6LPM0_9RHOB|nr:class I SAM-dependent methyltransferase [Limibaculum sp. NKW23]GMG82853.1 class I SAM-dependent methyltransferase [Limibaculum sp. NKW23]
MTERAIWSGDSYDRLMGRWSRRLAPEFLAFAGIEDGAAVLDIGCGTGAVSAALLDIGPGMRVTGLDGSADFLAAAAAGLDDSRAGFVLGDAQALPLADDSQDACVSLLVLNFVPDPVRAVCEMRRVTRTGGRVAAAVWDYGGEMEMLRILWDEAVALDPAAAERHEALMPLCRAGELAALCEGCGLAAVEETALGVTTRFADFEDYWAPFLSGTGPSGSYVAGLPAPAQAALRARLAARLAPAGEDVPIRLAARAWAVRAVVPA